MTDKKPQNTEGTDDAAQAGIRLTQDQEQRLADLVTLAMLGFAAVKSDTSESEKEHPAIAAFMPLVQDELDRRMAARQEEYRMRYGDPAEDFAP
jgi:hypothetical protein